MVPGSRGDPDQRMPPSSFMSPAGTCLKWAIVMHHCSSCPNGEGQHLHAAPGGPLLSGPYSNPRLWGVGVGNLMPSYKSESHCTERLSNWPKATEHVNDRVAACTWPWPQSLCARRPCQGVSPSAPAQDTLMKPVLQAPPLTLCSDADGILLDHSAECNNRFYRILLHFKFWS